MVYSVTLAKQGNGTITVNKMGPGGVVLYGPGTFIFEENTRLNVQGFPDSGWQGDTFPIIIQCGVNTMKRRALQYSFDLTDNAVVTFYFVPSTPTPPEHQYSNVSIHVTGNGSTNPPPGNYPSTYEVGNTLYVDALPDPGWRLLVMRRGGQDWTGATHGEFLNLALIEDIEVVFEQEPSPPPAKSQVTITVIGQGSTTPTPGPHEYDIGTSIHVTASASPGWLFSHMNRNGYLHTAVSPGEFLNLQAYELIEVVFVEVSPPSPPSPSLEVVAAGVGGVVAMISLIGAAWYLHTLG